ncbi:hypothetical protein BH09BAC5_BH09BAC5_12280 [soil metagenome]
MFAAKSYAQKAYFQQDVAYDIKVTLNDVKHELSAFETIAYKNNSPDELTFIYMHLWPNGYKDNNTPLGKQLKEDGSLFFYYAKDKDRGFIDSLDFKVDGQSVKLEYEPGSPDIGKIILNKPLAPGGQISISTPFHVKLPSGQISRLGHIDQQYQITQWYPKPAVYDKDGWEQIPYLNQGEFYSEFGIYDVYITLPKNYILGSTGDLINNPEEVAFIDSTWEATKKIEKYDAKDDKFPESSKVFKTVHYHQEHVHDFAWFCDKRYHVLKGEVTLPHTGKKVTTCVMYTNQYARLWKDAVQYVNDALFYYSKWNGDYTYDVCTAVDGALSAGGGMEYPNITVIGSANSALMLDIVITHEVGHNWFYGMLGSNERKHGWMDEGINSANELRYVETKYPNNALVGGTGGPSSIAKKFDIDQYKHRAEYYQMYAFCARTKIDQPIETHSKDFTTINYGSIMYMKSAVVFDYLRGYLGDSLYDKCFQDYFEKWHWHHPMPEDIRASFESTSGKDLSWFFGDMIQTDKQLDYKITAVPRINDPQNTMKDQIVVMVKNTGEINGPVCINALKDGKVVKTVWFEGFPASEGKVGLMFPKGDYDEFKIDQPELMPEVNRKNNTYYTHGLFKKVEPIKIQFLGSFDNPDRTQLFFTPVFGANVYDKFMVGAAFYNHVIPGKKFEWALMPMYSTGDKSLVGHADVYYHWRVDHIFQEIRFGTNVNQYHYYDVQPEDLFNVGNIPDRRLAWTKVAPEINFEFKKPYARSPISQSVRLRAIYLKTDYISASSNGPNSSTIEFPYQERTFYEAEYSFKNNRHINAYDFGLNFQSGDFMNKLSMNADYHININAKKTIDFRLFAGTFIGTNSTNGDYRFRMSGWSPKGFSNQDYLFDNVFIGRSEQTGSWSQQFAVEDGGFKVYSAAGQSNKWLTALNVDIPFPSKNKLLGAIHFYGDVGAYNTTGLGSTAIMYDAGIHIAVLGKGLCDVYFPLLFSSDIKDYNSANDIKFQQMIRFTLNLNRLNPFSLVNSIQI